MNLPNKLTLFRIFLIPVFILVMLFNMPSKYLIACVIFIVASITDAMDGHIARKYNIVTDFGKVMDAIADKVLVNSVLIILAANGFINAIIPVVVVLRDIVVNAIKMEAAGKGVVIAAIGSYPAG